MKILYNNDDLNEALSNVSNIGFVPTMGSLHIGHISLIKKSLLACNKTVVSIFVNPTQFNSIKDYKKYPKNSKKDLSLLKKLNIDFVFLPKKMLIYNSKNKIKIRINKKDKILCAKYRKGHFEGVLDVMTRLVNLINPNKIFMGEKDFQQLILVKRYIENNFKSKIVPCKTIRDKYKVALSSRNLLLKKNNLIKAGLIAKNLISFKRKLFFKKNLSRSILIKKNELQKLFNIKIQYLELRKKNNLLQSKDIKDSKLFIAYYLQGVRLIDNF